MIVGLTGAHRTGKTTLARVFAEKNRGWVAAETSVSAMMRTLGYDPALDYPFAERIEVQDAILDGLDRAYSQADSNTVFDRTPLDAAAYLLADIQRENVDPQLQDRVMAYVERCIEVTNRRFSMILLVPPVLPLVDADGKAPATPGYVNHISFIIGGLRADERLKCKTYIMPRSVIDIDQRVKAMGNAVGKTMNGYILQLDEVGHAVH